MSEEQQQAGKDEHTSHMPTCLLSVTLEAEG